MEGRGREEVYWGVNDDETTSGRIYPALCFCSVLLFCSVSSHSGSLNASCLSLPRPSHRRLRLPRHSDPGHAILGMTYMGSSRCCKLGVSLPLG